MKTRRHDVCQEECRENCSGKIRGSGYDNISLNMCIKISRIKNKYNKNNSNKKISYLASMVGMDCGSQE